MRGFTKLPRSYFDKYSEKPVTIVPFNPKSRIVAERYINKLELLLAKFKVEIFLRGSTAYGIAGKGEIEVGVYPKVEEWGKVIGVLKTYFGAVDNLEENYARFNDIFESFEIEVILLKGQDALVDKKLTEYLINSPAVLKEYEKLKKKYSYSKREYMIQKNNFFEEIINKLQ